MKTFETNKDRTLVPPVRHDGRVLIHKRPQRKNGCIVLTRTDAYRKRADFAEMIAQMDEDLWIPIKPEAIVLTEETTPKKKSKKHKKKRHAKHKGLKDKFFGEIPSTKNKSKAKKVSALLNISYREERPSNIMAELLKYKNNLMVYNNALWLYNKQTGAYVMTARQEGCMRLRALLSVEQQRRISTRELTEAYNMLLVSDELRKDVAFTENTPYVNCENGVFSVENTELISHSPKWGFNHCINAKYDPTAKGKTFLSFIDIATDGDKKLINLLQEVIGYTLSNYNNAKKAFIFYGPSDTGKSVILNVLGSIVGKDNVSHVSIQQLAKQEYAVLLADSLVNISPDLPSDPLRDIGTFKSLVSHNDTTGARALYGNPREVKGNTKMLFGSNHLLKLGLHDPMDIDAFFERIIYIPFMHPILPEAQDNNLSDKLIAERDFVFTWAMEGLKRYLENGQRFTECKSSERVHSNHRAMYNPAACFAEEYLDFDNKDSMLLTTEVDNIYLDYCREIGADKPNKTDIRNYLKIRGIEIKRKRMSGSNPQARYIGVSIKKSL